MNDESELHPILISLVGVKRMIAIGAGPELHLMSPSHMIGIIIMSAGIESHLRSAWETMM